MVTRPYYEDDEAPLRRYSRGHGTFERDMPIYSNARAHNSPNDLRGGENSNGNDQDKQRSRIPVACGRCRKRKIKCSGDNGGPCESCMKAGNEQCAFLRVQSTEYPLKTDQGTFECDPLGLANSRLNCRMIPGGPYGQHTPVGVDGYPPYRQNSISGYQYPVKSYTSYGLPAGYPEFAEENVDYGLPTGLQSNTAYLMATDQLAMSQPYPSARGPWGQTLPQLQKQPLYMDSDPTYSHGNSGGQLPYTGAGGYPLPLRTPISPDPKALALPLPLTGNDRVLPFPAANRVPQPGPGPGPTTSFLRSTSSIQPAYQSYDGIMMNNNLRPAPTPSETSSMSSGYGISISGGSPESMSSLSSAGGSAGSNTLSYPGAGVHIQALSPHPHHQSQSQHQPQPELYHPQPTMYHHPVSHSSSPSPDNAYGPSTPNPPKRGSHSNSSIPNNNMTEGNILINGNHHHQTSGSVNVSSLPPLTSGSLANGHRYVPYEDGVNPSPNPSRYISEMNHHGNGVHGRRESVDRVGAN